MSYILDALKKAERERDIKQVPTLMAAHEPRTTRGKSRWVILGTLAVCAGAAIWLLLFLQGTTNQPEPSPQVGQYSRRERKLETMPPGTTTSPALPAAKPGFSGENPARQAQIAPRAVVPPVPRNFPAGNTIDSERLQQLAQWMAARDRLDGEDTEDIPPSVMMERPQPRAGTSRRATKVETSVADESKEKPASLKEAVNGMTLSILVFDENKADRMVFINGRKYGEGEYVEDIYFLESITLEGAVLTYRGERALLRPKAK